MAKYDKICEEAYVLAKKETAVRNTDWLDSPWSGFFEGRDPMKMQPTGVSEDTLRHIGGLVSTPPPGDFVIHGGEYTVWESLCTLIPWENGTHSLPV